MYIHTRNVIIDCSNYTLVSGFPMFNLQFPIAVIKVALHVETKITTSDIF